MKQYGTIINYKENKNDVLYVFKIWRGSGYLLDMFGVYSFSVDMAMNELGNYLINNQPNFIYSYDEIAKQYDSNIEIIGNDFIKQYPDLWDYIDDHYIDLCGDSDCFILKENFKIEEIREY